MSVEDPIVRRGRAEAAFAIATWGVALVWSVGVSYAYGYDRDIASATFVLWFPDWVFWGIVVPWLAATAVSTWFALRYMGDEPLGEEPAGDDRPVSGSVDAG